MIITNQSENLKEQQGLSPSSEHSRHAPEGGGSAGKIWQQPLTLLRKAAVAIAGALVLGVGIALLVLPGPAFIVIPLGCVILAKEFSWARRLVQHSRALIQKTLSRSSNSPHLERTGLPAFLQRTIRRWLQFGPAPHLNPEPTNLDSQKNP